MASKETKAVKMGAAEKTKDLFGEALREHNARIVQLMGNGNGMKKGVYVEMKDKSYITVNEFKKLYLNHRV